MSADSVTGASSQVAECGEFRFNQCIDFASRLAVEEAARQRQSEVGLDGGRGAGDQADGAGWGDTGLAGVAQRVKTAARPYAFGECRERPALVAERDGRG